MASVIDGFVMASDISEGFIIETRDCSSGDTPDWMQVELIVNCEFGVMFYGVEMLSGQRFFTIPVPPCTLVSGWRA